MHLTFKSDAYACCALVLFLQAWPSAIVQSAVNSGGYVAGWSKQWAK
jgi:hypothetical protein